MTTLTIGVPFVVVISLITITTTAWALRKSGAYNAEMAARSAAEAEANAFRGSAEAWKEEVGAVRSARDRFEEQLMEAQKISAAYVDKITMLEASRDLEPIRESQDKVVTTLSKQTEVLKEILLSLQNLNGAIQPGRAGPQGVQGIQGVQGEQG